MSTHIALKTVASVWANTRNTTRHTSICVLLDFIFFPAREYMELHRYFSKRHNQESMFFA